MLPVGGRDYNGVMDDALYKKIVDECAEAGATVRLSGSMSNDVSLLRRTIDGC